MQATYFDGEALTPTRETSEGAPEDAGKEQKRPRWKRFVDLLQTCFNRTYHIDEDDLYWVWHCHC